MAIENLQPIFIIHLTSCAALVGLIWTIQLVHYPTFFFIKTERFLDFEAFHQQRITTIVGPLMLIELLTAIALVRVSDAWFVNLVSVVVIWIYTILVSMRYHRVLSKSWNELAAKRLVRSNWLRTLMWSSRLIGLIWIAPRLGP